MRVLHVAPSAARAYGGPTHSLVAYARAAAGIGIEVAIAAPRPPAADEAWLRGELPATELHLFAAHGGGAFVASPGLAGWLRRMAGGFDAVHVHGLWNPVSSLAARGLLAQGRPVVIRPFGTLSRYTFAHRRTLLKRAFRALVDGPNLRRAAALHFTTEAERDEAGWHGIDFAGRSWVIPPPALPAGASAAATPGERQAGRVVCVCRLNPIKNLEALLDAWPRVVAARPDARLVVAGEGDPAYAASLRARAAALGIAGQVAFPGFVEGRDKEALLASAELFVLPSRHENFGISVFEALAAGVPVVVTPEVQLAPFIAEHRLGLVVAADPDGLAAAVLRALGDAPWRADCERRAPALVAERFSPEAIGRSLQRMYRTAVSAPEPRT